jgi:genome maintenance exonuclease 1
VIFTVASSLGNRVHRLNAITTKSGRYYEVEPGRFLPSVTTVISAMSPKDGIAEWRARVGEAEADRISTHAKTRGTAVHALAERYLLNDPDWKEGAMPANVASFQPMTVVTEGNFPPGVK